MPNIRHSSFLLLSGLTWRVFPVNPKLSHAVHAACGQHLIIIFLMLRAVAGIIARSAPCETIHVRVGRLRPLKRKERMQSRRLGDVLNQRTLAWGLIDADQLNLNDSRSDQHSKNTPPPTPPPPTPNKNPRAVVMAISARTQMVLDLTQLLSNLRHANNKSYHWFFRMGWVFWLLAFKLQYLHLSFEYQVLKARPSITTTNLRTVIWIFVHCPSNF